MANITITIQAASDSIMRAGGQLLGEGDARKVYGLPNIVSHGITDPNAGTTAKIEWIQSPRWDEIKPPQYEGPQFISPGIYSDAQFAYTQSLYSGDTGGGTKPNPTTTAFQLRCENISHEFTDNVSINPLPAFDTSPGQHDSAGTPGQLNMIVLALGMRTEVIKLSGVLVDRGLVTAENPRRQVLLNIARMQHYKTGRGGQGSGKWEKWGGMESGALNPRSYPCLKIFESHATPGYTIGKEPSGDSRQYRGIIKDLSFRLEGGRPDHWFWNMTFAVIANEHSPLELGQVPWLSKINRVRLVDDNDGDGDEVGAGEDGYFEIRVSQDLVILNQDGSTFREMADGDQVYLSQTASVPSLNGNWHIIGVKPSNKTFIIKKNAGEDYGEGVIMAHDNNAASDKENELKWNQANFTGNNNGHVAWGLSDSFGCTPEVKS